ncbi:hypothetical protein [Jiulongibacter sediminis]|uniref:Uncharacterized protein n=1 Tax=Jiulongibacter sediminis TaxID=1605367 RepID=A0A0P7BAA6_9BACT|nr:hypothetical protein [Jiulongibacter sediminis]KPM47287.1 hypothetical protein AFM12_15945 [Jiulongibacter sediminis]TBX22845.1 hypothetical protein TK44_15955 [Jiulongibacter sediminis]
MPFQTGKRLLRNFILIFGLLISSFLVNAQVIRLENSPETFLESFEKVFTDAKNETSIAEFSQFKPHFENEMSPAERQQFIQLCQTMAGRNHKMPEYYYLLVFLNNAFNPEYFDAQARADLLSYFTKLSADQPKNRVTEIVKQLTGFLTDRIVYEAKFNKLYAFGGQFRLGYFDQEQDYLKEEIPQSTQKSSPEEDFGLFDDWDKEEEYDPWDDPSLSIDPDEFYRLIPLPKIKGLVLYLENVDLVMVSPSDSAIFQNTTGAVDLMANNFVGEKGSFDWSMVNIPEAKVNFSEYTFNISKPYLKAEKVVFEYPSYLADTVEGVFEFRGENRRTGEAITYPRFKSYENNAQFKNLEASLSYKGGFSLIGNRHFSSSLYHNISTLFVNKGLPNSFKVEGRRIEFTDSLITSDQISFTSYIREDSIYHPAVRLRYDIENKFLNLYKVFRGGFRNTMYSDTFHEMDIRSDAMKWDLKTNKMDFYIIAGKEEVPAIFQGFNYYNQAHLRELSNIAGWNPLVFLGNYVYRKKVNRFTLFEIEDKIQLSPRRIKDGVIIATQMGFLDYDPHSDSYSLSRKGLHYFKSSIGRGDYDDLVFQSYSEEGQNNASIDLNSNALDIGGTSEFRLSDSLGIRFLPKDKSLKMEGSKSFKFAGEISVKNYRFFGDFEVDYERFLVNLNRIDSITFTPVKVYNSGHISNIGGQVVYGKSGILYLNAPDNKSGRRKLPQYPRLVIEEGAIVRFDDSLRREFTYPEDVFFKIESIDHDSLNSVDMAYKGVFNSGGIIRPIQETLIVMPDTSIGFNHLPKGNYKLYGTNSSFDFEENLRMTKKGLTSKGKLTHLAALANAEKARFGSDELTFNGKSALIKEAFLGQNVYFPDVKINEYEATWKPEVDSLSIASDETFSFYQASTELSGNLVVRNSGLYGQGKLTRKDSEANSDAIKFNKAGFLAENSEFIVKSEANAGSPILKGQKVQLDFNVDRQIVNISPEESDFNDTLNASIAFPYAAYKTTIDNATWNIKDRKISMKGDVETSLFSSTAESQYGLEFNGEEALYDIAANTLNISGVPGIKTVDAIIIPENGEVAVRSEKLLPFTNATVIADTVNKYHTLANANITINSKLSYSGDASYQFVNVSSDTFNIKMQSFEFAEITPEGQILGSKRSGQLSTIARAKVTEADSIFLSPKMLYIGELTMLAPFRNLSLKGQVTPVLDQYPVLGKNWINYSGNKSEEIQINVDETLKDGGKRLYAGLHLNPAASSESLYPTFLSAKRQNDDRDVFLARGVFKRDEPNKRFVILGTEENPRNSPGNSYELYDELGLIKLDGEFNLLNSNLSQYMQTVGQAELELDSLTYTFNTLVKYNFPVPPPILAKMGDNIVKTNLDVGNSDPAIAFENPEFLAKLAQFTGPKGAEDYKEEYYKGHVPLFKHSPKFFATAVFSDLHLKWNPVFNSYHNAGRIGISNIGETDINAMVPGYFEIIKNPHKGDEITFFLEVSPSVWYYFAFKEGQLGIASSDFEFNKMLTEKDKASAKGVELINADMAEAMNFRKRFMISYLGVDAEIFEKPARTPVSAPGQVAPVAIPQTENSKTAPQQKEEVEQDGF